jgi:capsular polysaccharide transport system permease protein
MNAKVEPTAEPEVIAANRRHPVVDRAVAPQPVPAGVGRLSRMLRGQWLKPSSPAETVPEPETQAGGGGRRGPSWFKLSFVACVIIPAIASWLYFAFIAADQYVATSRFAVRTAATEQQVELPSTAARSNSFGVPMVVGQDAYLIVAYIQSHKIIQDLLPTIDLRKMFRHPNADFWARLEKDATAEELEAYWKKHVQASVDGPSGIVTVRVRAFTPDDATTLLQSVLAASEKLANDVSARARRDTVSRAEEEVRRTLASVQDALKALQGFRERVGFVDPVSSATMTNTLLLQMLAEKIRLENELFVMQRVAPDNGTGQRVLRTQIQSVDQQVDKLKGDLTGATAEGRSIATALVEYEALELQRLFTTKMFSLAQEALTRATQRAERQNIYVTVFVAPAKPEEARYPERWAMALIVPISLLIIWGIFAMVASAIDDHRV